MKPLYKLFITCSASWSNITGYFYMFLTNIKCQKHSLSCTANNSDVYINDVSSEKPDKNKFTDQFNNSQSASHPAKNLSLWPSSSIICRIRVPNEAERWDPVDTRQKLDLDITRAWSIIKTWLIATRAWTISHLPSSAIKGVPRNIIDKKLCDFYYRMKKSWDWIIIRDNLIGIFMRWSVNYHQF